MLHEKIQARLPVALLVDAENISHSFAQVLLNQARQYGVPTVRRAYGKATSVEGWEEFGYRLMPTRPGRNSADLLLCAQAMALALNDGFHTLLIASSDGGFAYVVEQLRELGHEVIGLGAPHAPPHFRNTCTRFVELRLADTPSKPVPEPQTKPAPLSKLTALEKQVQAILQSHAGAMALVDLNIEMRKLHQTKIAETPEKTWRAYFQARPKLFTCEPKGPNSKVRLNV